MRRWASKYVPLAFVFGACFVVPGSGVAFSIVQGVALSHATASSERALDWMKRRINGAPEEINHDLQKAILRGYERAIDHLAAAWKDSHGRDRRSRQDAELATSLFRILKEDAAGILSDERIQEFAGSAEAVQSMGSNTNAASFLEPYLYGHDEQLRGFLQRTLEPAVALYFGEELKDDTRAWRAFQRLVTDSMIAGFARVESGQQELAASDQKILAKLERLAEQLESKPEEEVVPAGRDGLEQTIESMHNDVVSIISAEGERTRTRIDELERNVDRHFSAQLELSENRFAEIKDTISEKATRVEVVIVQPDGIAQTSRVVAAGNADAAEELLGLLSFFAPDEIPLDLIIARSSWLSKRLSTALNDSELAIIDALSASSEDQISLASNGGLSIPAHVLIDAQARLSPGTERSLATLAMRLAASWLPADSEDPATWPVFERVAEHVLAAADEAMQRNVSKAQAIESQRHIARYLLAAGKYERARQLFDGVLAAERTAAKPGSPRIADATNDLARALLACGEFARAREFFEQALGIQRKVLRSGDPSLAIALNGLGEIDLTMNAVVAANEHLEEALQLCREGLPSDDRLTALTLGNLARVRGAQNDGPAAAALSEESLEMTRRLVPPDHPAVGDALEAMGASLSENSDRTRRTKAGEESLELRRRILPPDHPDIAASLYLLGEINRSMSTFENYTMYHNEAFAIRKRSLPPRHLDTAKSMSAVATANRDGDREHTNALRSEALSIYREVLPDGHPTTKEEQATILMSAGAELITGAAKWASGKFKGWREKRNRTVDSTDNSPEEEPEAT